MSESNTPSPTPPVPKKEGINKSVVIISLLLVIIVIQGIKWYLDSQEIKEKDNKIATTEQELAVTMQRLSDIKVELDQKITEIKKLGGDVSELQKAKKEIETELKRTKRANGKMIKDLKDKVEGYETLLIQKDKELEKLQSLNKELYNENISLKTEKNQMNDSISQLEQTRVELASKVAIASRLKVENMKITGLNDRGKERESPFKSRTIETLKIEFNLGENSVAPIEGKKIIIRIIDENNQVLFDVTKGSGTFMWNNKEEFYTAVQEILFDNSRQKLTFLYQKGSEYAPGNYVLEVYTDDYMMGKGNFTVK